MKPIEEVVYSGWMVSGGFEGFEEKDLYFKKAMAMKVLEKLLGYRMG